MYLDAAKKQEIFGKYGKSTLTPAQLRPKWHCFPTVFLT